MDINKILQYNNKIVILITTIDINITRKSSSNNKQIVYSISNRDNNSNSVLAIVFSDNISDNK